MFKRQITTQNMGKDLKNSLFEEKNMRNIYEDKSKLHSKDNHFEKSKKPSSLPTLDDLFAGESINL